MQGRPCSPALGALGRAIRSGYLPSGAPSPVTLGTQTFDIRGNALTTRDALGRLVEGSVYDLANQPLRTERLDGGTTRVALDAAGAPLESLDPRGARNLTTVDIAERFPSPSARPRSSWWALTGPQQELLRIKAPPTTRLKSVHPRLRDHRRSPSLQQN